MKRVSKMLKWTGIFILLIFALVIITVFAVRLVNSRATKIDIENGIQEMSYIEIGGIEQYIQIRGEDKDNPIIVFLHGGPGFPLSYLSYSYQRDLEEQYTFVCWDQRGAGRTYYANSKDKTELSPQLLMEDLDELVDYLRNRFGQEKVIVMGQSWGTILGSKYALEHPEKVETYIGVGQVVDFDEGKILAAQTAMKLAQKQGNIEDAEKLQVAIDIFSKKNTIEDVDVSNLEEMIILSIKYLEAPEQISGFKQIWQGLTSPSMTFNDLRWFLNASSTEKIIELEKPLIDYMYFEFDINEEDHKYEVPVYFVYGDGDWITPYPMVEEYYEQISAPDKKMILIENTGHTPFLDKPNVFCEKVKEVLSGN